MDIQHLLPTTQYESKFAEFSENWRWRRHTCLTPPLVTYFSPFFYYASSSSSSPSTSPSASSSSSSAIYRNKRCNDSFSTLWIEKDKKKKQKATKTENYIAFIYLHLLLNPPLPLEYRHPHRLLHHHRLLPPPPRSPPQFPLLLLHRLHFPLFLLSLALQLSPVM